MQNVLDDKLVLVTINFGMFGGYRRATPEHIKKLGGKLPKSKAITEGSIKVLPNDALADFQAIRRSLFRNLSKLSIRAFDAHNVVAIPRDELSAAEKLIRDASVDFDNAKNRLGNDYDAVFEQHVAANPEAEAILRSLKVPCAVAVAKCHFSKHIFQIKSLAREGQGSEEGIGAIVNGLGRQLYVEVAAEMQKLSENAVMLRSRVGQKSVRPIKAAIEKMRKFTFLDPAIQGAIDLMCDTLAMLPSEGYIEGKCFDVLQRLVRITSDADDLLNAASKVTNGITVNDVLFPPSPVEHPQPEPVLPMETMPVPTQTPAAEVATEKPIIVVPSAPSVSPVAPAVPAPVFRPRASLRPNALTF